MYANSGGANDSNDGPNIQKYPGRGVFSAVKRALFGVESCKTVEVRNPLK